MQKSEMYMLLSPLNRGNCRGKIPGILGLASTQAPGDLKLTNACAPSNAREGAKIILHLEERKNEDLKNGESVFLALSFNLQAVKF